MLHKVRINLKSFKNKARETMMPKTLNFIRDDTGVTAMEYALLACLIAMVIVASVGLLGKAVASLFSRVGDNWPSLV
jgi:pilus assembly protein Flp/PilA